MNKKLANKIVLLAFFLMLSTITSFSPDLGAKNDENGKTFMEGSINIVYLKDSGYWNLTSTLIFVNDTDIGVSDWATINSTNDWCSGAGTWEDPYVIENVTIDGGGSGNTIEVINSNKSYFVIRNCTVFNATTAIKLYNTTNGMLLNNTCKNNTEHGIYLESCNNVTLQYNKINYNNNSATKGTFRGIYLLDSNNNTLKQNDASNNIISGWMSELYLINLYNSHNNSIIQNNISNNKNEDNALYTYAIYIQNSNNNTIINNSALNNGGFYITIGIYIHSGKGTIISNNSINDPQGYGEGIKILNCEFTNVTKNTIKRNVRGIVLQDNNDTYLSENIMEKNGIELVNNFPHIDSHFTSTFIETSNLVNGKPFYYYKTQEYLTGLNFTNPGGILLYNCSSVFLPNVIISFATLGIMTYNCTNMIILNFTSLNNTAGGIGDSFGKNNTIMNSTVLYSNIGISFVGSNNTILNTNVSNIKNVGIEVMFGGNNTIKSNNISFCDNGIYLSDTKNNTIVGNNIYNNTLHGIHVMKPGVSKPSLDSIYQNKIYNNLEHGILAEFSSNLTIFNNTIMNNNKTGIRLISNSDNSIIYYNYFIGNTINAQDSGANNQWDNGSLGNYWDDYGLKGGVDLDDNGLGDTDYDVPGTSNDDRFPIWDDGEDAIPIINVGTPNVDDIFSLKAPNFSVSITEQNLNASWYSLFSGGAWSANYTFNGTKGTGTINQTAWNECIDGSVLIRFFANDSKGYLGQDEVSVIKDTLEPTINLISPVPDELFGKNPPAFIVEINDTRLDSMWYFIPGGMNRTFATNTTFNALEWSGLPNGTATIWFHANDTAGNLNSISITVRIDAYTPIISIISPEEGSYHGSEPGIQVIVLERFIDTIWYNVTGNSTKIDISGLNNTLFSLDQYIWSNLNEGMFQVSFHANDTAGNVNDTLTITLYKDTIPPVISVIFPENNSPVSRDPPNFIVNITEASVHSIWYSLNGGQNHYFTTNGTINQTVWLTLWDSLSHGDVINITFYVNDSLGRLAMDSVLVKVDQTQSKNGQENGAFDIINFLVSPEGIITIGITIGIIGAIAVLIKKKKSGYKSSEKETRRIEDIFSN